VEKSSSLKEGNQMIAKRILGLATLALLMASSLPHTGTAWAKPSQATPARGVLFAGLQNGYLYRSTDGGYTWQEADYGLPPDADITALAVAWGTTTIYAATGGSGIYISTDEGLNWQDDNAGNYNLQNSYIRGVVVDPAYSQDVYALTDEGQFYASTDRGASWTMTSLPTDSPTTTLALNPGSTAMLLAGTQESGIFQSPNRGNDWYNTNDGSIGAVNSLAFNPRNPDVAFAATSTGMYQTIDAGNAWEVEQRGIPHGTGFQAVAVDPSNGARIIAGTPDGRFYRSQDGGTSWTFQGTTINGGQINSIVFNPAYDNAVLAGTGDGNIYRSDNNGGDWYRTYNSLDDGILVLASAGRTLLPTDPVPAPLGNPYGVRYFSQTHHTVHGLFLSFYNKYGGLKIFGLPLTEAFAENGRLEQYFERSLMVYSNGRITLAPLGSQLTTGHPFAPVPCCPPPGDLWFWQTGHSLSGMFLTFWRNHNGSLLFGYPISQPLYEQNGDGTGRTYLVQYFQKARLEYHPELAGTGNVVTLGLLGQQALRQRGWL
jgi:photosystem II stability/assembly factor-like uncharacterized protein